MREKESPQLAKVNIKVIKILLYPKQNTNSYLWELSGLCTSHGHLSGSELTNETGGEGRRIVVACNATFTLKGLT